MVSLIRYLVIIIVLLFAFGTVARAQDSTRLKRFEYVLGSAAVFSLFDYVGYNVLQSMHLKGDNKTGLTVLHLLDAFAGAGINYFLYSELGLSSAISFDLTWWTWGDDMGFYGWTYLLNPASPWVKRTNNGLRLSSINWAGWTPIGIVRAPGSGIARSTLLAQALTGFAISIAILW